MSNGTFDTGVAADATSIAAIAGAATPNIYNRSSANLRKWQRAIARVLAKTGRGRVVFVGDSKDAGAGAGTSNTGTQYYITGASPKSKPDMFATLLAARNIPASRQSWFGSKVLANTALISAYDSRLAFGASWSGGAQSLGGVGLASGGTDSAVFTPPVAVDTVETLTQLHAGAGTLTVTAGASATVLATISGGSGGEGFTKTVVPLGSLVAQAINVQRTAGGFATLFGEVAYDSTNPAIDVINAGAIGTTSAYHITTAGVWAAANTFATLLPDLVIIQLGSNDLNTGVDVAVYTANIQNIITAAKAAGADVVLEIATYGNGYGTAITQEAFRQAVVALGYLNGCVVIDHAARFISYAAANALGLMKDAIHETDVGYADEALALVQALVF